MDRISQIDKEIDELETVLLSIDKEWDFTKPYDQFESIRKPHVHKINILDREKRLLIKPTFEALSTYGSLMTLEEFIDSCKSGGFIDYDGHGRYVKDNMESNIYIYPSDVKHNSIRTDFTHIIWFNR